MSKFYIAGPMTGHPWFNFPAFHAAAKMLRDHGLDVVSPAELDGESDIAEKAMASESGDLTDAGIKETWGDLLARDVKIISDEVDGIILLPGWAASRGARLEAFVGLLRGDDFEFYVYVDGLVEDISRQEILQELYDATV